MLTRRAVLLSSFVLVLKDENTDSDLDKLVKMQRRLVQLDKVLKSTVEDGDLDDAFTETMDITYEIAQLHI